ncbi:MAG: hypothetical protein Q8N03_06820 [Ignavibacteria bacterium]|jgi:hypothetical protein|nr:hypothetical protein [Ignavibacteria bacterium]
MENKLSRKEEIAEWMLNRLKKDGYLYQEVIVHQIVKEFGEAYIYENDNGNLSINKSVLKAFRKITEKDVVWDRVEKMWELRKRSDTPGKRQLD